MNQKVFILMGMSGCGKGTQGKLLADHIGGETLYVQTGAEIREFIKGDSYTQRLTALAYDEGKLMPEFITISMWANLLAREYKGNQHLIIDGSPRKIHEAGTLHSAIEFYKLPKPYVIHFKMTKAEALQRLLLRKRLDDNEDDIQARLDWYDTHVLPTVEFYRHNPHYSFIEIDADQSVEKVFADILVHIDGNSN
jgi:adenylate kinase family enzyme